MQKIQKSACVLHDQHGEPREAASDASLQLSIVANDVLRGGDQVQRDLLQAQDVEGVGTWHTLFDGCFQLSRQAARLLGLPEAASHESVCLLDVIGHEERALIRKQWKQVRNENQGSFVFRCARGGTCRWLEVRFQLERNSSGRSARAYGTLLDITERYQADQAMQRLACYDGLTGVYNRTCGLDKLQAMMDHARRRNQHVVIMFADLDRFKAINDTHGHAVGDRVLQQVAGLLEGLLECNDMLARMGGDEFLLARRLREGNDPLALARRISHLLSQPLELGERTYSLGVSVGVSLFPVHAEKIGEVLHCADLAMYQIKSTGGGYLLYESSMKVRHQRRVELAKKLELALAESQLELHYQPKIGINSGKLIGVEALARWHDAEWGWISPAEFIPVAEERGLIAALESWGLTAAARQWKTWQNQGYSSIPPVAVNISGIQISMSHDFAERVQTIILLHGIPARALELEITESALTQNAEKLSATAQALVDIGFSLSVDDFGTGYSSLAQLHSLPLSCLKIDTVFIRNMLLDKGSMTIVKAIISMARALGLQTIAEGVERIEQFEMLKILQCDSVQGFLFSEALPAAELEERWLASELP